MMIHIFSTTFFKNIVFNFVPYLAYFPCFLITYINHHDPTSLRFSETP